MIAAEKAHPTPLSADEQAEQDALDALDALRGQVSTQQRAELADYGDLLADAVRAQLEALKLPVPVTVTVDLDTAWNEAPETPAEGWTTNAIDAAIVAAISSTPTPDTLPGTLLERAETSLRRERSDSADE